MLSYIWTSAEGIQTKKHVNSLFGVHLYYQIIANSFYSLDHAT